MHIGLIGGIGVAATIVYYQRLTKAIEARGAMPDLTIVHSDAKTLVANNLADRRSEQAAVFAPLLHRLKDAGADCAAITSLGGHFCFEETRALSPLPLVSAVSPLDTYFASQGIGTIGLLGTQVVMATRLYGQLTQTQAIALDRESEQLGQRYIDMAVSGVCTETQRATFLAAGARMMAAGADAIVLAGTDLNLAFNGRDPGYPVIDALDVHVDLLADIATGHAPIP